MEARDESGYPRGGLGLVGGRMGRSGTGRGTYRRSGMDWDTLGEIGMGRETLSVFLDGSEDPWGFATN